MTGATAGTGAARSVFPPRWGAWPQEDGTRFRVWAPRAERLALEIAGLPALLPMEPEGEGEYGLWVPGVESGAEYTYVFPDGARRPDPASRWQPRGVHGPSAVVDPEAHEWRDDSWFGVPLEELVLYELHIGTFTPEGTFDAAIDRLPYLRELGVTAIEIMPVAQFPGARNWGYDGVLPYAVQNTYGGPAGLKRLVDACHREGLGVCLDVVYNHIGPEGNVLPHFGPYFTDQYRTPWGRAINFDGTESDHVRRYLIENALHWQAEYHVDALRLDAVQGIYDAGAVHFLRELADAMRAQGERLGRRTWVIGESDQNDPRLVAPPERNGFGLDGVWNDDWHHSLHAVLAGSRHGYFADFESLGDFAKAIAEGFVYDGRYSRFRRRRHGRSSNSVPAERFVVYAQNHDQVANPYRGRRLTEMLPPEAERLLAMLLLLGPNVPLLFMGQEYGETRPFHYFTSHTDEKLADAVRRGRQEEFSFMGHQGEILDPQAPETFSASRLDWSRAEAPGHRGLLALHRHLLALRRALPFLRAGGKDGLTVRHEESRRWLTVVRRDEGGSAALLCNLAPTVQSVPAPETEATHHLALWSGDLAWEGPVATPEPLPILGETAGAPAEYPLAARSAALYLDERGSRLL